MKKQINKILKYFLLLSMTLVFFSSCEDAPPNNFIEEYYVEGYLIVDEPIRNIIVMRTQPIADTFDYEKSIIRDAVVTIKGDGKEFVLVINPDGEEGYYAQDNQYLVKPGTEYNLTVEIDGITMTGKTTTPERTEWVLKTPNPLQFPKDTLKLPATDEIKWKGVEGHDFYMIQVKALDTLEYGIYLDPPTEEKNRRVEFLWSDEEMYYDHTNMALIANTESSVVWSIFKWYGLQEVVVYVPDWNFTEWFIQSVAKNQYDPLLGSIEGGMGTFASAAVIRDTVVLLKNQP